MTSQSFDATIGGVVYNVTVQMGTAPNFGGDISVGGDVTVGGDLTVTNGTTTLNGNLAVTGAGLGNGDLSVAGDIDVTGVSDLAGRIQFSGAAGIYYGSGSPEGAQNASVGSLWLRTDGSAGSSLYIKESGTGSTGWVAVVSSGSSLAQSWAMPAASTAAGTHYTAGFYYFASSASTLASPVSFGTANSPYGAHAMLVATSGATDTEIRVSGTSITDAGVRTTSDTETITLSDGAANTYYETSKKWIGQVTFEKTAGTNRSCNYGFCKYWDNLNQDFTVVGGEALWEAGANDAAFDIILYHHKATGWTYNAGAEPTPPTPLLQLTTEYSTESDIKANEPGAWKRTGLSQAIEGSGSEGIIIAVVTGANNSIDSGTITMNYTSG